MTDNLPGDHFIDTNILVFAYDISAGQKNIIARQLVEQYWESGSG